MIQLTLETGVGKIKKGNLVAGTTQEKQVTLERKEIVSEMWP